MRNLVFLFLILAVSGCNRGSDNDQYGYQPALQGIWLLTERGYSPGSGYIVEPVPPLPAQTITISGRNTFSSNMQGFEDFKFYEIVADNSETPSLNLYIDDPEAEVRKVEIHNAFRIVLNGSDLKLMQIGCFEGCHLGFRKTTPFND
jgi:hypothetical protein